METVSVSAEIRAPVGRVWDFWTNPDHIVKWNNASDDWHTPFARNDLRIGGSFVSRMEARDGSSGFDFSGVYTNIKPLRQIDYTIDDGRSVSILFRSSGNFTIVEETFEIENVYPAEMQRKGWQSILDNFTRFVEASVSRNVMYFKIEINADTTVVYGTMLNKRTYSAWTSVFNPESVYVGSWDKGSKIVFLGIDRDGSQAGMISKIRENIPDRYVSNEHIGIVHNGEEIFHGSEVKEWSGALENYTFTDNGGSTILEIDLDVNQAYTAYFKETWPKALELLKSICEKQIT